MGALRDIEFVVHGDHSKSHPKDDKPSVKAAWSHHVTYFKFLVPPNISLEQLKLVACIKLPLMSNCPSRGCGHGIELFSIVMKSGRMLFSR